MLQPPFEFIVPASRICSLGEAVRYSLGLRPGLTGSRTIGTARTASEIFDETHGETPRLAGGNIATWHISKRFLCLETHVTIPESPCESDHDKTIIKARDRGTYVLFPMAWLRVCVWCVFCAHHFSCRSQPPRTCTLSFERARSLLSMISRVDRAIGGAG